MVHNASAGDANNINIVPDTAVNSPTHYRATDYAASMYYIDAMIVVIAGKRFAVETKKSGFLAGSVPGKDFFAAMIAHFGLANIDGVNAIWVTGIGLDTNIDDFNAAVSVCGDTPAGRNKAALDGTWTGSQAMAYGFTMADVYFRDPVSMPYFEARVKFTRP